MFERHGVLNRVELNCRADIAYENYCKILHIEALTLQEMVKRDIIPAISGYTSYLCRTVKDKRAVCSDIDCSIEEDLIKKLSDYNSKLYSLSAQLENELESAAKIKDITQSARIYHDKILWIMEEIRICSDKAETVTSRKFWPYPTYADLLYKV
jgi:glutamine synthetase